MRIRSVLNPYKFLRELLPGGADGGIVALQGAQVGGASLQLKDLASG